MSCGERYGFLFLGIECEASVGRKEGGRMDKELKRIVVEPLL